jgi:hypothetical protein
MKPITFIAAIVMAVALAIWSQGCAKLALDTTCPAGSIGVSFALAGSTIGNQAIAMLGTAVSGATLAAKQGDTTPPATKGTMTYEYVPIFGADSGSLTCIQAPQQTVVVTSAPASIVR